MKKISTALVTVLLLIPVAASADAVATAGSPVVAAANPFDGLTLSATSCRRWGVLVDDLADHAANDPEALYNSYVEREVKQERARVPAATTEAQRATVDQTRARFEATTRSLAKMAWDNRSGKPYSTTTRAHKLCLKSYKSRKAHQAVTKAAAQ